MINTEHEKEIIPDSLEIQMAYWESYRPGYIFSLYAGGESLLRIAKDRNMPTTESLEAFLDRNHEGWRKMHPAGSRRIIPIANHAKRVSERSVSAKRNEAIVGFLARGYRVKEIANEIGITPNKVSKRIAKHNLREVAARDNYKPAYAA